MLDSISKILELLLKGVVGFVEFILSLPDFIYMLFDCIPKPFSSIVAPFLGFIIFLLLVYVVIKIVSTVKGG